MKTKKYSFTKGFLKGLIAFMLFAVPFFNTNFPDIANLSIGAILVIAFNALKYYYNKTFI